MKDCLDVELHNHALIPVRSLCPIHVVEFTQHQEFTLSKRHLLNSTSSCQKAVIHQRNDGLLSSIILS